MTPLSIGSKNSIGGRVLPDRGLARSIRPVARLYRAWIPGMPTSLMPFYGRTPAEAAKNLSDWLTRAHDRMSKAAGSV